MGLVLGSSVSVTLGMALGTADLCEVKAEIRIFIDEAFHVF